MAANLRYHDHDDDSSEHLSFVETSPPVETITSFPRGHFQLHTLGIVMVLVFLFNFSSSLTGASTLRIYESIICHGYYKTNDPSRIGDGGVVDERHCKVDAVQEELAVLTGWESFFNTLPGLFLAIPFGFLADKYGRKWLLVLNVISLGLKFLWTFVVCAFPSTFAIRMVWLNGALGLLGGGALITTIFFVVVVTDITQDSERATVFFYTRALIFISSLIGQPLGSVLMARSPWIPLKIGLVVNMLGFLVTLALPETLNGRKSDGRGRPNALHHRDFAETLQPSLDSSNPHYSSALYINGWNRSKAFLATFFRDSRFLIQDWRILLILSAVAASIFTEVSGMFHLPYVSKRYVWPLSRAAYLTSFQAGVSIIALLAALPTASSWLRCRKAYTAFRTDLLLARVSFTFVTAGLFLLGLAPSISLFLTGLFIFTLGAGLDALLQSLLASLVPTTAIARLFTITCIVQTVAMLAAAPFLAGLYRWGLQQAGNAWIGSPFICCGIISGVATVMMWLLRIEKRIMLPDASVAPVPMDVGA